MSNPAPEKEVIEAFHRWAQGFNDRDTDAMLAEMHFPHMRLVGDQFQRWETPADRLAEEGEMTRRLDAEGWHHTETKSIEAVQVSESKVHLVIRQSRQREDGTEYNGFDTLWIFTKHDGRWGARLRSSFLVNAVGGEGSTVS